MFKNLIKESSGKSPWLFHINAGSCNGCDIELVSVLTPRYDAERLGFQLTGSPRHADIVVVTGPVTAQSLDRVLRDLRHDQPVGECVRVFRRLVQWYDTYIVCAEDPNRPERWGENLRWIDRVFGVPAWNRVIVGNHPELLMGDYLLTAEDVPGFMGTVLRFGEEPFRDWTDVQVFFERLGGQ